MLSVANKLTKVSAVAPLNEDDFFLSKKCQVDEMSCRRNDHAPLFLHLICYNLKQDLEE
jgi:hypothetical protein